jgi:hypothetical protein
LSATALGILLLGELALAVLLFVISTRVPAGPDEGLGLLLLAGVSATLLHLAFAVALAGLYAVPDRLGGGLIRLTLAVALAMALAGSAILAASGVSLWTSVAASGSPVMEPNGWLSVRLAGPPLFLGGLGLYGLVAGRSANLPAARALTLFMGSLIVLGSGAFPSLALFAASLPGSVNIAGGIFYFALLPFALALSLGIVVLGIGFLGMGWFLLRMSNTQPTS